MLGDSGKHLWANLFAIAERPDVVRPSFSNQLPMGAAFNCVGVLDPPDTLQGSQNLPASGTGPRTQAMAN